MDGRSTEWNNDPRRGGRVVKCEWCQELWQPSTRPSGLAASMEIEIGVIPRAKFDEITIAGGPSRRKSNMRCGSGPRGARRFANSYRKPPRPQQLPAITILLKPNDFAAAAYSKRRREG